MTNPYDIILAFHNGRHSSVFLNRDQIESIVICELLDSYRCQTGVNNFHIAKAIHNVLQMYLTEDEIKCILEETT